MSNLFTQLGDVVLQEVAPKTAAEAVCVTTRQYRCVSGACGINGKFSSDTQMYRDCTCWRNPAPAGTRCIACCGSSPGRSAWTTTARRGVRTCR